MILIVIKTTLIYHLNTLEQLGMKRLDWYTTLAHWHYLAQHYFIDLLTPWFLIIVIKTRLIYHMNTLELLGMTIPHCPSLEHLETTWYNKTKLIYHLNTLELLGMPRLHWCTTWTLWNYLVWQDYSDLPLNTLELHDKITLIYHLNTLEQHWFNTVCWLGWPNWYCCIDLPQIS